MKHKKRGKIYCRTSSRMKGNEHRTRKYTDLSFEHTSDIISIYFIWKSVIFVGAILALLFLYFFSVFGISDFCYSKFSSRFCDWYNVLPLCHAKLQLLLFLFGLFSAFFFLHPFLNKKSFSFISECIDWTYFNNSCLTMMTNVHRHFRMFFYQLIF